MDELDLVFGALADPTRRAILVRLTQGESTVADLARRFPISLPAVSKHLKVLETAGLIKQRVARSGAGKRGGFRTVIAYRKGTRAFFLLGFPKSARANIDDDELAALRRRAAGLLAAADQALDRMIADEDLTEVDCGESTHD